MGKSKKFDSTRFRKIMDRQLYTKGYRSVSSFVSARGFHRNPLARAMAGMTRPSLDTINAWCKALECTPEERAEIIASIYIDEESPSHVAA